MTDTWLTAYQVYDFAPLGSLIRFSDGTVEPPARHHRKHAAWASANATGRLVRMARARHVSTPSFTLHLGDFGSGDVTVLKAYRVFTTSSQLSYAILDRPRPGQVAVLQDENGIPTLIHLANTGADAENWLKAQASRHASRPDRRARASFVHLPAGPRPRLAHCHRGRPCRGRHILRHAGSSNGGGSEAHRVLHAYRGDGRGPGGPM